MVALVQIAVVSEVEEFDESVLHGNPNALSKQLALHHTALHLVGVMNGEFLKNLGLPDLFRNFFSGAFFVVGIVYCQFGLGNRFLDQLKSYQWIYLGLSILMGTLLYVIHRAVVIWVFELIRFSYKRRKADKDLLRGCFWILPRNPVEAIRTQNIDRWKAKDQSSNLLANLTTWADQIHYLYTTSLALALAAFCAQQAQLSCVAELSSRTCNLYFTSLLVCSAGFLSDWRRHTMENLILDESKNPDKKSPSR